MKKRVGARLLALVLIIALLGSIVPVSAASNYYIGTAQELADFAAAVNSGKSFTNKKVILTDDIVLNENLVDTNGNLLDPDADVWTPIGTTTHPFKGTFDGKGHSVSGMYIPSGQNIALFGVVTETTIYNIIVKDSYVSGSDQVGAVMGLAQRNSLITNCHNYNTTVLCSSNRGGGVVGQVDYSDVYNCSNYGYVYAKRCAGGICGDNYRDGEIYNCANYGTVKGNTLVGGISGGTTSADIQNCFNAGTLLGSDRYLIAGGAGSRNVTNCYALQNSEHNPGLSLTSGNSAKGCGLFQDASAVLNTPVTAGGRTCTTALQALNAWKNAQTNNIAYQDWRQPNPNDFPYLDMDLIPSVLVMTDETFNDVNPEDWYYDEVKYVYDNGLMDGTGDKVFSPSVSTTRGMVVTILYRQEGEPEASPCDFKDISSGRWYSNAVSWAAENGIVTGYPDGNYRPNQSISREELAAILYRYAAYKGYDVSGRASLDHFTDGGATGNWALRYVKWAVSEKLLNGSGGLLRPNESASRAEVATVLMRYCTNLVE